jgi:APA family basic amino acid/polyamine antiporter
VLAAEEPSRIRGGALLGGLAGARDNFVGDATKYVVSKAPCEVILTAPRSSDAPARPLREPVEPAAAAPEPHDESISAAPPLREK